MDKKHTLLEESEKEGDALPSKMKILGWKLEKAWGVLYEISYDIGLGNYNFAFIGKIRGYILIGA